jgi:hypothetical protein
MGCIAEVSTEIEENLTTAEKKTSVDASIIIDSFNDQITRCKKLCD